MAAIERTAWAVQAAITRPKGGARRGGRWRLVSLWTTRAEAREHCNYEAGQRVRIRRQRVESWRPQKVAAR